jgi:hypothetical protein
VTSGPVALITADAPLRPKPSNYPEPFASRIRYAPYITKQSLMASRIAA